MHALHALISDYTGYAEEEDFWTTLKATYPRKDIDSAVIELLNDGSADIVSTTCMFVRDIELIAPRIENPGCATGPLANLDIAKALEQLLSSDELLKRESAVYTMGKVGSITSLPVMKACLERTKDSDPLLISRLAFEICWLSGMTDFEWYRDQLLLSNSFLTRWAGLDVVSAGHSDEPGFYSSKIEAIAFVQNDSHHRVKESACFLLDKIRFEQGLKDLPSRSEKRKERRSLEARRPPFFDDLDIRYRNHMREARVTGAYVEELRNFCDKTFPNNNG